MKTIPQNRELIKELASCWGGRETCWGRAVCAVMFAETLEHVGEEEVYVVAGDGTQTRRSRLELVGSLH